MVPRVAAMSLHGYHSDSITVTILGLIGIGAQRNGTPGSGAPSAPLKQVTSRTVFAMVNERGSRTRGGSLPVGSAAIGTSRAEPYRYTMADLERETGLPGRTIRYYITEGLLPAARGRGVGATYNAAHLLRLKAIAALKETHTPLAEIRQRLEGIRESDLAAMLHVETAPPEDRWRRVHLHDDLELHVRERGGRDRNYALEKVVDTIVRQSEILIDQELKESR